MSTKDRFSQPVDVLTEDEWENGDDEVEGWGPTVRVERPKGDVRLSQNTVFGWKK